MSTTELCLSPPTSSSAQGSPTPAKPAAPAISCGRAPRRAGAAAAAPTRPTPLRPGSCRPGSVQPGQPALPAGPRGLTLKRTGMAAHKAQARGPQHRRSLGKAAGPSEPARRCAAGRAPPPLSRRSWRGRVRSVLSSPASLPPQPGSSFGSSG